MRAWLTPDLELLSNPQDCRKIAVPGDLWYLVQGALELLCMEQNWEQYGDATPEQMSQYFMGIIDDFGNSPCGGGGMSFIDAVQVTIDTYTDITHPSGIITIPPESIPSYASDASSLLLQFTTSVSASGLFYVGGASFRARQIRTVNSGITERFSYHVPYDNSVRVRVLAPTAPFSVQVDLIGWW